MIPGERPGLANGLLVSLKPPILLKAVTLSERSRPSFAALVVPPITMEDNFLLS